jgi:hypothetical protein
VTNVASVLLVGESQNHLWFCGFLYSVGRMADDTPHVSDYSSESADPSAMPPRVKWQLGWGAMRYALNQPLFLILTVLALAAWAWLQVWLGDVLTRGARAAVSVPLFMAAFAVWIAYSRRVARPYRNRVLRDKRSGIP